MKIYFITSWILFVSTVVIIGIAREIIGGDKLVPLQLAIPIGLIYLNGVVSAIIFVFRFQNNYKKK